MKNMKLIVLASAGLFLVMAPASHLQVWGDVGTNPQTEQVAPAPKKILILQKK